MARTDISYGSIATEQNQFQRLGFPGRYHSAITVATTATASFTGSNYGYGAILIGTGANTATSKIFVAGGGVIDGNDLRTGTIYDISAEKVQSTGGNIFVLKRQQ
jgi:hypothetical protein